jgi:hypothetical protein
LLDVLRILDMPSAIEAARVFCANGALVDDANGELVGAHEDALADEIGRHRVRVAIEADARLFADDRGENESGVVRTLWQRAQSCALDDEAITWPLPCGAVQSLVGDLVTPAFDLLSDVIERR